MRSITNYHYNNVIRWDRISKHSGAPIFNSRSIPLFEKLILRLHENRHSSSRDKYVSTLCLETISHQKVSSYLLKKGTYKNSLASKRTKESQQSQVTLRKNTLFFFLDTWTVAGITTSHVFSFFNILYQTTRTFSLYQKDYKFLDPTWQQFSAAYNISTGPLQIIISKK